MSEDETPVKDPLSFLVGEDLSGERVDRVLAEPSNLPRAQVARWITQGRVRLGAAPVSRPSRRVPRGARCRHLRGDPHPLGGQGFEGLELKIDGSA